MGRAVANKEWCARFQAATVMILAARTSNHHPVHVMFGDQLPELQSYKRGFKFEDKWATDEECQGIINAAWDNDILGSDSMQAVQKRLSSCQQELSRWSWQKFGNVEKQLNEKTKCVVGGDPTPREPCTCKGHH